MATKELTWQERFDLCDWSSRDSIVSLMPQYVQEQYKIKLATKKDTYPKNVNIESFTLKTPFGDQTLLDNTELVLEANKRQCLYGSNGTGKTLLFTNMAEAKIKDFPKHLHVHHCRELETHELSESVLDTVLKCYPHMNILRLCNTRVQEVLASTTDDEKKAAIKVQADWIAQQLNWIGVHTAEERAVKMLRVLGFDEIGQKRLCSALSGGLRMRVALCMAFFIEADLLLLDEPTNHLDFPSVLWLENRLRAYRGSFLMVSHDRELLNNVCTSVLLLEEKKIKYYMMGFVEFEKTKTKEDKKKFDEIEKFLAKNVNVDPSTMLGRQKADKQQWSQSYYQRQIALAGKFTFPVATPLENNELGPDGKPVAADDISLINLKDLTFSYDVNTGIWIFKDPINFNVTATTRVGVMGPNGAGKSTLLKLLTHKLKAVTGSVVHHPNFKLAYFGQHSTAELNLEETAMEFMISQFPEESSGTLRNHLAKTGVVGNASDTRMHRLAYSQRSCIVFAKLTFVCPHLLIMDEPTNFLDLESVDSLISACNKYKGALLLVSHNRDFLRKCAKQFLSVVPGHFELYGDLKTAERATYTFIEEMEETGTVSGANALKNNPGGGSVHSSQRDGAGAAAADKKDADGVRTLSIGSMPMKPMAPSAASPSAAAAGAWKEGDKVTALWTDGKYYAAVIQKVLPGNKYTVKYTEYGNSANVPGTSIKPAAAPAGKAAPGAAAAAPKAGAAAAGAPKKK